MKVGLLVDRSDGKSGFNVVGGKVDKFSYLSNMSCDLSSNTSTQSTTRTHTHRLDNDNDDEGLEQEQRRKGFETRMEAFSSISNNYYLQIDYEPPPPYHHTMGPRYTFLKPRTTMPRGSEGKGRRR